MLEKYRLSMMRLAATVAILLLVYPGILIVRMLIFRENGSAAGHVYAAILVSVAWVISIYALKAVKALAKKIAAFPVVEFVLDERANAEFVAALLIYSTLILPIVSAIVLFVQQGILRILFEVIAALIIYTIGVRAGITNYSTIFSHKTTYTGIFFMAGYVIVSSYVELFGSFRPIFMVFACMFIAISLLLLNQSNLDTVFIKRDRNLSSIPDNIRRYNGMVVAVFILILALLFNMKTLIVYGLKIFGRIVGFVMWIVFKIIELLYPGGSGAKAESGFQLPFGGGADSGVENPLTRLIMNTLACFIVLYILYKIAPTIIGVIVKLTLKFIGFLKKVFARIIPDNEFENADYNDEIETIRPSDAEKDLAEIKKGIKSLRKSINKITDPVEKVRCFYALIVLTLKQKHIEIKISDTTGEILKKSFDVQGIPELFKGLTSSYEHVRYGDHIPDESELSSIEQNYSKSLEVLKGNKGK